MSDFLNESTVLIDLKEYGRAFQTVGAYTENLLWPTRVIGRVHCFRRRSSWSGRVRVLGLSTWRESMLKRFWKYVGTIFLKNLKQRRHTLKSILSLMGRM